MRGLLRRGVPAVEGGLLARGRGDADAHAAGDADADAVRPHSDAHTLLDANTDADLDVHADTDADLDVHADTDQLGIGRSVPGLHIYTFDGWPIENV